MPDTGVPPDPKIKSKSDLHGSREQGPSAGVFISESTIRSQILRSIPLILEDGENLPALHTITADDKGNIYFSDEFNHRVISLDPDGVLRWQTGGKGGKESQFWYPRGIALGWIETSKGHVRGLAVCDGWNNRIQFFNPEGQYICSWNEAGGRPFGEVCDIRFIGGADGPASSFWLVLDRGNNRLCGLSTDGREIFESGRTLPPSMELRWMQRIVERAGILNPEDEDQKLPVFDPLFYPTLILGSSEPELYIFEPYASQLKQPLLGSLLPLSTPLPKGSEWIAASKNILLFWDAAEEKLKWMNINGEILSTASAEGKPIHSSLAVSDVWIYVSDRLELRHFETIDRILDSSIPGGRPAHDVAATVPVESADYLLPDSWFDVCDQIIGIRDPALSEGHLLKLMEAWKDSIGRLPLQKLWLGTFLLSQFKQGQCWPGTAGIRSLHGWPAETEAMVTNKILSKVVGRYDQIIALRTDMPQSGSEENAAFNAVLNRLDELLRSIAAHLILLYFAQVWFSRDRGLPSLFAETPGTSRAKCSLLARPPEQPHGVLSRCLREVDRFDLAVPAIDVQPNPCCIARMPNGHFFVSLFSRGTLVHLDPDGKRIGELFMTGTDCTPLSGPAGLAADRQGRLWIVESVANRLRIFDPNEDEAKAIIVNPELPDCLSRPFGIVQSPCGQMLVADCLNHRIVTLDASGKVEVISGCKGKGPGELFRPVALNSSAPDGNRGFWVVESHTHRVQEFDWNGQYLGRIGNCGITDGSLLVPWHAVQFADGALAVNQHMFIKCLKLISAEGTELDCLFPDFFPAGMLIDEKRLLVADWSGGSIRVFERIG
jgi:hypothetical protein